MTVQMPYAETRLVMEDAPPARDVADFHLRWREFRPAAVEVLHKRSLNRRQSETLAWMIELIDRIGREDLPLD